MRRPHAAGGAVGAAAEVASCWHVHARLAAVVRSRRGPVNDTACRAWITVRSLHCRLSMSCHSRVTRIETVYFHPGMQPAPRLPESQLSMLAACCAYACDACKMRDALSSGACALRTWPHDPLLHWISRPGRAKSMLSRSALTEPRLQGVHKSPQTPEQISACAACVGVLRAALCRLGAAGLLALVGALWSRASELSMAKWIRPRLRA